MARTIDVRLLVNDREYVAKMKNAGKVTKDTFDDAAKKSAKSRQAIDELSTGIGLLGAAAVGGAGLAVKSFANFDKAMSSVKATGDDARGSFDALRKAAIKAGADTAFSATEAAGGVENLLKAGVSAEDVLGGGLAGALDLAAAGQIGVADAAETAATAMTQFKLSGKDVPHIADLLAAGAGKAQGEVSDMAMALKQSGLVASQFGLSIEDTTGTLAAFASAGLIGSDAGTSFKTMLLALANPADKTREAMEGLGIAAYDANGNFVGITNLAQQLKDRLGGLDQATRDQALAQIFGNDAIRAANVLYEQGADGITKWINNVNDAGYAAETAATKMDNLAGDWEAFTGSLETALIGAGEGANGPLRDLVQQATEALNAFSELPPEVQQTTLAIAGGGGLVLLGVAGLGKLITTVADVKDSIQDLGLTSQRAGRLMDIAAKGALVATAAALAVEVKKFSDATKEMDVSGLADDLERFGKTGKSTGELLRNFGEDFEGYSQGLDVFGNSATSLGDAFWWVSRLKSDTDLLGNGLSGFASGLNVTIDKLEAAGGGGDEFIRRIEEMDAALAELVSSGNQDAAEAAFERFGKMAKDSGLSLDELKAIFPEYQSSLKSLAIDQEAAGSSAEGASTSIGKVGDSSQENAPKTQTFADTLKAAAEEAKGLQETADLLYDSLGLLNGQQISAEEAAIAFRDQIRGMAGEVKALKEEYGKNGTSLKANTAAGDANRKMLLEKIQAAERAAKATFDQAVKEKGTESALKSASATMNAHIQTLREEARRLGLNGKEVDKYIAKQLGIPESQITNFTAPGLKDAVAGVKDLVDETGKLKSKNAELKVKLFTNNIPKEVLIYKGKRDGGLIRGPGTGTSDTAGVYALSDYEFVMPAAETRKNLAALEAARSGATLMAVPGMAKGGLVGRDAVRLATSTPGLGTALDRTSAMGNAYNAIPGQLAKMTKDFLADAFQNAYSYSDVGGSGVQRWAPMVQRALGIVGQPASYTGITLRRMNQESGGNPTIVNRWDSNWLRGTPSVGLMQVIGPTYRAYRHPAYDTGPYSYGTSVNPLANTLASMRYALSRYESLPSAYNRKGGYDTGGWLMPGRTDAWNGTGRPERVLSHREYAAIGSAGPVVHRHEWNFYGPIGSQQQLQDWLAKSLDSLERQGRR